MSEPYSAAGGLVRVYPPMTPPGMIANGAGLVWVHGGGFAGGDLDMPEADGDPEADAFGPDAVLEMYQNYLGGPVDGAPLPAIPGRATAEDLAHFPPTLMINGEVDELRVSGEHFARTLAAGREIVVLAEPGTRHGHLNRPDEPAFAASIERIVSRLAALSPTHTPEGSTP
jgi:acetyl esterase/lipase